MANEEQRRAFASYMAAGSSAGQQTAQYPGTYANSGNPYLYQQQFPGVSGLPAAPTPPPAASSSIASYPSYTGGLQGGLQGGYQGAYQGGFPQGGFQQGGYQQTGIPHRPPPLGEGEGFPSQQRTQQQAGQAQHTQIPRGYENQPPQSQHSYNGGYQYSDPRAQQNGQPYREANTRSAMVPSSRNFSGDIVESRSKHVTEFHRHEYQTAPPAEGPPPVDTVPVLLCHTCSVCGQMRSAGYHRNHPVIPGKPLVLTPCRKCKKKVKTQHHSMSNFTRVRTCTADEPCDWPAEDIRIDIDRYERRGRQRSRSRDTVFIHRSSSRPHIIRQSSSQARLGLRSLQRDPRMPEAIRSTRVRMSSLSPGRASRYDELHPHPDIIRPARSQEMRPPPPTNANQRDADEVWPPPDGVRAHLFRKAESRTSSRIVELTPSPPPEGRRSTRVVYRTESVERRHRSVSRGRRDHFEERRAAEAEARMMSHPRPFRAVHPEEQNFRQPSDETSTSIDDLYHSRRGRRESPGGGILKSPQDDREQSRRRASMRESQQSTRVEIGGPRVHFSSGRRAEEPAVFDRGRPRFVEDDRRRENDFEVNYSQRRYVEDPTPPVEEMDRIRIRRRSLSPRSQHEEDIRIDRARGISPSPSRHVEDVRIRHVNPGPPRERAPRSPPIEERKTVSGFRHVSREEVVNRARSMTPPRARRPTEDDMTDSESAHSGEVTEVRTWKGIDENGKPATFVEERRRVRMLEQGSEKGGQAEFRPLNERVPMRSWRDV